MKLKALTRMSLRKSPDKRSKDYGKWYVWEAGAVFEPPKHLNVKSALARGIAQYALPRVAREEVSADG